MANVAKIEIRVTLADGRRADAVFLRREKVEDLMLDRGSLGAFLRDLVKPFPEKRGRLVAVGVGSRARKGK